MTPSAPEEEATSPSPATGRVGRPALVRLVELFGLSGFVVAQPVFDVLARASDLLIFRSAGRAEVLGLAIALVVVPPLVLWCVELAVAATVPAAGRQVHAAIVGLLLGLFTLQVIQARTPLDGTSMALWVAVVATVSAAAYRRWPLVRTWLLFAAPAPLVFMALFLSSPSVYPLLASSTSSAEALRDGGPAAPVVVLLFDELPLASLVDADGQIDPRLYPNFAALAEEATFYRNATGAAARTPHAVPAMLTGRFPRESAPPVTSRYPGNLFALLSATHDVTALESVTALCPTDVCRNNRWGRTADPRLLQDAVKIWLRRLAPGTTAGRPPGAWLRDGVPTEDRAVQADAWFLLDRVHEDQPSRFESFLSSITGAGTTFHFAHVLLPHAPWHYLPDGLQYPDKQLGLVNYEQRTDERWPAVVDRQRHVLQAMYVDHLLGRAMDRMRQVGLYDRAALLVTADHGISFQPGLPEGTRRLHSQNQHEVAWVPFLLKAPGQVAGVVRDDNVMAVDVAPTVAALAGLKIPWPIDGRSVLGPPRASSEKLWFNEPGEPVRLDSRLGPAQVLAHTIDRVVAAEHGQEGAYVLRAFADVLGVDASARPAREDRSVVARVDDLAAVDSVDPSTGEVPSLVTGYLHAEEGSVRPDGVALVLNGVVAGASELYAEGDHGSRFAAMVPPRLMHPGRNVLEVLLIDRRGEGVSFRRAAVEPA